MDNIVKYLNTLTPHELFRGYRRTSHPEGYECLFCSRLFEKGIVVNSGDRFLEAERAVSEHIEEEHGGVFSYLLGLDRGITGITEIQSEILELEYRGLPDKEIARKMGGKSVSTVRNHRFQLRKRRREALVLLTLLDLLETGSPAGDSFIHFRADLPVHDDRVIVTEAEGEAIRKKYFLEGVPEEAPVLDRFPRKQKEKLVVLNEIVELFEPGKRYAEGEVNRILAPVYEDYVTIRRYLIDYGFLARTPGGSAYWREG